MTTDTFEQAPPPAITIDLNLDRNINYALQQNDVPIIRQLRITNPSDTAVEDLQLIIRSEPEFFPPCHQHLSKIAPNGTWTKSPIDLRPDGAFLRRITERIRGDIVVELANGESSLAQITEPIEFLAFDEWSGLDRSIPEIVAAFVLPNDPTIEEILKEASLWLKQHTGHSSIDGYQSKSPRRVGQIAQAIYQVVQSRGISYCNPPASFEANGQKVRLPDRIMLTKLGTCLDLTLLLAACLEQAGLHPLVVMTRGHAFVGVWLIDECFSDCASDDVSHLRKRQSLNELLVFESTLVTAPPPNDFNTACSIGKSHLEKDDDFVAVIDIHRCRKSQIRPLPSQRIGGGSGTTVDTTEDAGEITIFDLADPTEREAEKEPPATRVDRWKRKLLDLSLHNKVINFKPNQKKAVPIICPDLGQMEDSLADGLEFVVRSKPDDLQNEGRRDQGLHLARTGEDGTEAFLRDEIASRRLYADLTEEELNKRLTEIYRHARTAKEEGGASALYLGVGFLKWFESNHADTPRLAPIILVPLDIQRKSIHEGYHIVQSDEETRVNVTLLELLKKDHGITIDGLDPVPTDDHGVDVPYILNTVTRAIKTTPRWEVLESANIGFFSFTKFLMWLDLEKRSGDLERNDVVRHLIHTSSESFSDEGTFPEEEKLDEEYPPDQILCPMPADSSQLSAVLAGAQGKNFVLFGPPGTGKSQTITNLIAQCLGIGKSVLFVSEKMAALGVVHDRLEKSGLGPFCMEVHSAKSSKRHIIDQLGAASDHRGSRSSEEWGREAVRLARLRNDLNDYTTALHQRNSFGESAFIVTSNLIGLRSHPLINLSLPNIGETSRDQLDRWRDLLARMKTAGLECGVIAGNAWSGANISTWSAPAQQHIADSIRQLHESIGRMIELAKQLGPVFGLGKDWAYGHLTFIDKLLQFFVKPGEAPSSLLISPNWEKVSSYVGGLIKKGRERDQQEAELFGTYEETVLALDLDALLLDFNTANAKWFLPRFFGLGRVRRVLAGTCKAGEKPEKDKLLSHITQAQGVRDLRAWFTEHHDRGRELLGSHWQDGRAKWDTVDEMVNWSDEFRGLASKAAGSKDENAVAFRKHWAKLLDEHREQLQPGGKLRGLIDQFANELGQTQTLKSQLEQQLVMVDDTLLWGSPTQQLRLTSLKDRLERWQQHLNGLQAWCYWRQVRREAVDAGLQPVVGAFEAGSVSNDSLRDAFDRSFYEEWLTWANQQHHVLGKFYSPEHQRKIQEYQQCDQAYMHLTPAELQARIATKKPTTTDGASEKSEAGILNRQRRLRRGHMPVRKLFQEIPNLLPRLKPCLLMSPISVAQYLDASHPPFDVVVFDEASQIPVWDAVGAIARGASVIVVGDPKQLPPTNFFMRSDDSEFEDEDIVKDMESILDECLSASIPERSLKWHYRSRHESLITFSNHHYYDNSLLTFPSPAVNHGVSLRYLPDAVYDKGKSRTNRVEADAVVDEIITRLKDPDRQHMSIGVVTFSQAQQTLIEDLLDAEIRKHPEIEVYFTDEVDEPVFVKNLENVQGDQRDVILFSVCYGPDQTGRVSMNFGPLNRDGGERRLNVAVTRACNEIVVFSSIRAEHIDLARTRSVGVTDFKCFLDYADRGPAAISQAIAMGSSSDFDSPFERDVCNHLRDHGYQVDTQVGCSGYRIDLAVRDPDNPGRYVIGIECDGAAYHRAKTARDRDRLRQEVLEGLGWTLTRVWSTDWWNNPQACIEKLKKAIDDAIRSASGQPGIMVGSNSSLVEPSVSDQSTDPDQQEQHAEETAPDSEVGPTLPEYDAFKIAGKQRPSDEFYDNATNRKLRELVEKIVHHEWPVHVDVVTRRVVGHWGMKRVGTAIRNRMDAIISLASVATVEHDERLFLWPQDRQTHDLEVFRIQGAQADHQRDIDHIPPEEIVLAIVHVLRNQISLPRAELIKETAQLLGFGRVGRSIRDAIGYALTLAEQRDDVRVEGDQASYSG